MGVGGVGGERKKEKTKTKKSIVDWTFFLFPAFESIRVNTKRQGYFEKKWFLFHFILFPTA